MLAQAAFDHAANVGKGHHRRRILQRFEGGYPLAREEAALADLTKQGVTIVRLTAAQRAAFRTAMQPVYARWTGLVGADLLAAA